MFFFEVVCNSTDLYVHSLSPSIVHSMMTFIFFHICFLFFCCYLTVYALLKFMKSPTGNWKYSERSEKQCLRFRVIFHYIVSLKLVLISKFSVSKRNKKKTKEKTGKKFSLITVLLFVLLILSGDVTCYIFAVTEFFVISIHSEFLSFLLMHGKLTSKTLLYFFSLATIAFIYFFCYVFHKIYSDPCACNKMWLTDCQPHSFLSVLILLNLTVALHTVNHSVLVTWLHGVSALSHLASYCSNHLLLPMWQRHFLRFRICHLEYTIKGQGWLEHCGVSLLSVMLPEFTVYVGL